MNGQYIEKIIDLRYLIKQICLDFMITVKPFKTLMSGKIVFIMLILILNIAFNSYLVCNHLILKIAYLKVIIYIEEKVEHVNVVNDHKRCHI